jgi:hypothetical protein
VESAVTGSHQARAIGGVCGQWGTQVCEPGKQRCERSAESSVQDPDQTTFTAVRRGCKLELGETKQRGWDRLYCWVFSKY